MLQNILKYSKIYSLLEMFMKKKMINKKSNKNKKKKTQKKVHHLKKKNKKNLNISRNMLKFNQMILISLLQSILMESRSKEMILFKNVSLELLQKLELMEHGFKISKRLKELLFLPSILQIVAVYKNGSVKVELLEQRWQNLDLLVSKSKNQS